MQTILYRMGFPGGTVGKNPPANATDTRDSHLIPASGRPPGEGNGSPVQYSCLENSMDREAWLQSTGLQRVGHNWATERAHTHTHICRKDKYPVINHNGKECEIECIHTYNWITLLYSTDWHNIVNQIYFNKIKKNFLSHSFIGAPNSVLRTSTWGSQFLPGIPE